jgi:hypothetical protein
MAPGPPNSLPTGAGEGSMSLAPWAKRTPEEANLFNPALLGLLASEFIKEFSKARGAPCPFVLPFCALPIALHSKTRAILPGTTITSLYTWRERNPDALVGYAERAKSLRPAVQEAIRFCIDRGAVDVASDGGLRLGRAPVSATKKFELTLTHDAQECISAAKLLGRWFAKAGTTSTILAAWGIKP